MTPASSTYLERGYQNLTGIAVTEDAKRFGMDPYSRRLKQKAIVIAGTGLVVVALDLGSKEIARRYIEQSGGIAATSWVRLQTKMSDFSMLGHIPGVYHFSPMIFTSINLIVAIGFIAWAIASSSIRFAIGLTMIAAGSSSNLVERLTSGRVTDFISIRAAGWQSPPFNLADLFLGLGVLVVSLSIGSRQSRNRP